VEIMSKTEGPVVPRYQPGDVFVVPLPGGWYGAARILRCDDEREPGGAYFMATTPYLERKPPELGDPRLRQVLSRRYFAWAGQPALVWMRDVPAESLTFLGNLALDDNDRAIARDMSGSSATGRFDEALWQWRWDNDREAVVAEVKARQEECLARLKRLRQTQKPKKMLADDDFWRLITLLGQPTENLGVAKEGYERLVTALSRRNKTDIKRFEEALTYKLYLLDTQSHAERSETSDDGFLYARCAVVVRGREYYESVRDDPEKMPSDAEFEDLLSVAPTAYERKTGKEFDYETGCCYETGSNIKGWPEK
jgi:hypothetical protein